MAKINVVGVGPGGPDYLVPAARRAVEEARVLVGGERNLALFDTSGQETFVVKNNLAEMVQYLKKKKDHAKVAVLASGDPGLFGILSYLRKHFGPEELKVIPGISSAQYACARLALPWQDAVLVSTHGRDLAALVAEVSRHGKVVALAGPGEPPSRLARAIVEAGIKEKIIYICSELSYPQEEIRSYSLAALASGAESWSKKNYVMVILDE